MESEMAKQTTESINFLAEDSLGKTLLEKPQKNWTACAISLWSEFLGTFLLVFVGCGVGGRDAAKEVNSIAFFFVLIFLIEAFLPFSGAHFNPVVSLVMYLSRTVSAGAMVMFAIVQCLASTLASFLILYLLPEAERMHCSATTVTKDWHNIAGIWKAIFLEAIMTAVLIYVILMTGIHPRSKERSFLSTVSVAATQR